MGSKEAEEELCNTESEDGNETITTPQKKRSRRVKFADVALVHAFNREEDYDVPPDSKPAFDSDNADEVLGFFKDLGDANASDNSSHNGNADADDDDGDDDEVVEVVDASNSLLWPLELPSPATTIAFATFNNHDTIETRNTLELPSNGRAYYRSKDPKSPGNRSTKASNDLKYELFFTNIEQLAQSVETSSASQRDFETSSLSILAVPSKEQVEQALKDLKYCLSFSIQKVLKSELKEKFMLSMQILSWASSRLPENQASIIKLFWSNFANLSSKVASCEQDLNEYKSFLAAKDQILSSTKNKRAVNLEYRMEAEALDSEEANLLKRLEEIKHARASLEEKWEKLLMSTAETKAKWEQHNKDASAMKKKKKVAESEIFEATLSWATLRSHFE